MNAKDMIAMMEYMKAFDKSPKPKWRKEKKPPKLDLVAILREKEEEVELINKFIKEREKINKKEDKKEEKKGHSFTFAEGIILAYAAQFIIGPLYKVALVNMGIH